MSLTVLSIIGLGFGLAYANGANDVSKGIATLVGSGVTNYRRAILWGTIWTAAGGLLGAVLAKAMVAAFGSGFLTASTTPTLMAATATLIGAGAWVLIATRTGLPVSTTHAIVGSIAGVAVAAYGVAGLHWSAIGGKILIPLLISPVASFLVVTLVLRFREPAGSSAASDCACAELEPVVLATGPGGAAVNVGHSISVVTGHRDVCAVAHPRAVRVTLDHLHWLTSGAASFARGLNDAPKIVALVLAATALHGTTLPGSFLFAAITAGMVLGSIKAGQRVTHVLAEKITPMNHHEGFYANLVTACLVTAGATLGWPMSTTHVASGGIVGAGAQRASLNFQTFRNIALAWVVTLPASAGLGIAAYAAGKTLFG